METKTDVKEHKQDTTPAETKTPRAAKKRCGKRLLVILAVVAVLIAAAGVWAWSKVSQTYSGETPVRIYIPEGATSDDVVRILAEQLGDYGADVGRIWGWRGGAASRAVGSYVVTQGDRAWSVANRLRAGAQTPIKLTFNNIRTLDELASRVSAKMSWNSAAFMNACEQVLPAKGYDRSEQYIAAFVPDTYEVFWTDAPDKVVERLTSVRDAFWTAERRAQADKLHLTPVEVTTVASIVEEETAKGDERPHVARLYLNRLAIDMPLQADPTVKFAIGDFSLRRITGAMLRTPSPYNTYVNKGLPPGPIRMPERATIDGVLNAPSHNYLYMCAREDFSGYHNFAVDYATHRANAERYRAALDARGIK